MSVKHWWNDTDSKTEDLSQCHFVDREYHTVWPEIEAGLSR